ncbi:hypothetical protein JD844_024631 [Phrynosoma platyrhinos]|uniref:Peptidyl-prolyl cis-trans isomerase n=1 Tax=Phrynosoma platyrhinos TaxID=52577 RepID=A0ABQ7SY52_PHRPL|nr:hypothetical protein JD844_024631 [Phrynosoma platyrhinos]
MPGLRGWFPSGAKAERGERRGREGKGREAAMAVLLETTLGDLVVDLYTEERPRGTLDLAVGDVHRDFIVQTGDPQGTGRGGESIFCKLYGDQARFFEAEKVPRIKHKKKGTVSMVNNGNDQHGSQFLITTGENLDYLDGVHTVFGEVTEGMDVLMKINEAFVDKDFVPYQDIRVNHTVILDDPFDDPPGLTIPDHSPEPTKEQLDSGRIGADEEIDDFKGRSVDEVEEILAEKEAKTQAILLEMVGDLPDADIKPPENVLFVCKLNPVTTDEDLEIIFSRFGPIKSCEVIRDWKTGESLCYAFIEFEKEEDCEKAYFKMDNVLIDDRRIHVDFSQSVAKIKWKGKGGKYTKDDFKEYEKDCDKTSKLSLKEKAKPKQDKQSNEKDKRESRENRKRLLDEDNSIPSKCTKKTKHVNEMDMDLDQPSQQQGIIDNLHDMITDSSDQDGDDELDSGRLFDNTNFKHLLKQVIRTVGLELESQDKGENVNKNNIALQDPDRRHKEESSREKRKSDKRERHRSRSRSQSRNRDNRYKKSKDKHHDEPWEREHEEKRKSRSPKKSREKNKSKYR